MKLKELLHKAMMPCLAAILVGNLSACTASSTDHDFITAITENSIYRLDTGDKVKITIFGEADLSGEYSIDGTGAITLPLTGETMVAGMTPREAEKAIETQFQEGYLKKPRVSLEVIDYRPFYIMGEVRTPGSYEYVHGMTVMNAVALSGGFTYRANRDGIVIQRPMTIEGGLKKIKSYSAKVETVVLPGDIIEIEERLF